MVDQATRAVQPNPEQGPTPMAVDEKPVVEPTQIPTTVEKPVVDQAMKQAVGSESRARSSPDGR